MILSSRVIIMSEEEEKVRPCLKVAFAGTGYMDNDNSEVDTQDPRYIEDNSVRKHYSNGQTQKEWFIERRLERKENPYYAGFLDYVTNRLSYGIYFTGKRSKEVNDFYSKTCPDAVMQLRLAIRSAVGNGPGYQRFFFDKKGNLKQIVTADHEDFELQYSATGPDRTDDQLEKLRNTNSNGSVDAKWIEIKDLNNDKSYFIKNYNRMNLKDYQVDGNRLGFLRLIYDEDEPYGEPVGEASWFDLKSMKRLNRNIMAGLERNLSETVKIGLDLDAYDDDEKETKLTAANNNFKGVNWNAVDSFAHDQRIKIGRMGVYPDDGNTGEAKMLEPGKIIEPVLSSILFSYYVAIGLIEQTGANKSLIVAQMKDAERGINILRHSVRVYLMTQQVPLILNGSVPDDLVMRYRPDLDAEDIVNLFTSSVISREYAQEALGIVDDGKDYFEKVTADAMPKLPLQSPKKKGDNNDDTLKKKGRTGPQSKGAGK